MKATIKTIKSSGPFLFKYPTEIIYECGPKKRERFYFTEATCPEFVRCLSTVLSITKQGSIRRIKTKNSEHELKRVK